eukprot:jgi/Chlat1/6575/Chrsp45S05941
MAMAMATATAAVGAGLGLAVCPSAALLSARGAPRRPQAAWLGGESLGRRAGLLNRSRRAELRPLRLATRPLVVAQAVAEAAPPPPAEKVSRQNWNLRELIRTPGGEEAAAEGPADHKAGTLIERWSKEPTVGDGKRRLKRIHQLGGDGQLLVELTTFEEDDPEATTSKRKVVKRRQVVLTSDAAAPLVLHWGVARDEPGQWVRPPTSIRPDNTTLIGESAETPFSTVEGCFEGSNDCVVLQRIIINMEEDCVGALMGMQFVVRKADNSFWFKDEKNGWSNFHLMFGTKESEEAASDQLTDTIIRAETTGQWWTLMHRYNLANGLVDTAVSSKNPPADLAKIFVWLRYSAQRKLTWQRNYNVKPRELSAAQNDLTFKFTKVFIEHPKFRDHARMTLSTIGRGGQGGDGQAIRDEILNIMHRNDIKEDKGLFLEQWHQKLHNNTTPDDIIICEAYLEFLRSDFNVAKFYEVLESQGITRERLRSFERPIVDDPLPRPDKKDALMNDFQNYLKILKRVHSGADLEQCIESTKGKLSERLSGLLNFLMTNRNSSDPIELLTAIVEARQEVRNAGVTKSQDVGWVRELLYLDVALENLGRMTVERASADLDETSQLEMIALVLENLILSTYGDNEELVLSLLDWKKIQSSYPNDHDWPLRAKAVVDRLRYVLSLQADESSELLQPPATIMGRAFGVETWAVQLFAEEIIRGGPAFAMSLLLTRMDKVLRKAADLGSWQVISPSKVTGYVKIVDSLKTVQNRVYDRPTVLIAEKVSGGEEIPGGAVAVLTPATIDVLSHSAVRARNASVFFATCFDKDILDEIKGYDGGILTINVGTGDKVTWEKADSIKETQDSGNGTEDGAKPKLSITAQKFAGKYAVSLQEFTSDVVGAKSRNTLALKESLGGGKIPDWVGLPISCAVPFGTFEQVLDEPENKEVKAELQRLIKAVDETDEDTIEASLQAVRNHVMNLKSTKGLEEQLKAEMKSAGMEVPEGERWEASFTALKGVWASKWNTRAWISVRNVGISHDDLRMSVLVQRIVPADYAFVIHTVNPSSNDTNEIYAEVVKGLGEALVGNYPGRAMSFVARKDDLSNPRVLGFPSKSVGLFVKDTYIFRSDSNGEDLEGYAGAGLYESLPVNEPTERLVDYSNDRLVWDADFRKRLLAKIAEVGAAVETALGSPQDIEGAIEGENVFVVQTRPQV